MTVGTQVEIVRTDSDGLAVATPAGEETGTATETMEPAGVEIGAAGAEYVTVELE